MRTTADVLHNHLASFSTGNLEGILADYAPKALLFTPNGPLSRVCAIRPFLEDLIAEFSKPGASFEMTHQAIEG